MKMQKNFLEMSSSVGLAPFIGFFTAQQSQIVVWIYRNLWEVYLEFFNTSVFKHTKRENENPTINHSEEHKECLISCFVEILKKNKKCCCVVRNPQKLGCIYLS